MSNSAPPEFFADRSLTALCFEKAGEKINLESVFESGFVVRPEDCPLVLSLLARWFTNRSENAQ
jgi:hypothetical protein